MRPADLLAKAASKFQSRIELARKDENDRFDCKSILAVMTTAAVQGTELMVYAEGDDCEEALETVRKLFEEGFGELEG
jgi:phosphotransferase system HPr (HPr) family protein